MNESNHASNQRTTRIKIKFFIPAEEFKDSSSALDEGKFNCTTGICKYLHCYCFYHIDIYIY